MNEENGAPVRRRVFPEAFKREAVERVETSGLTYQAVADESGLHETVLRRWVRKCGSSGTGCSAAHHKAGARTVPGGSCR